MEISNWKKVYIINRKKLLFLQLEGRKPISLRYGGGSSCYCEAMLPRFSTTVNFNNQMPFWWKITFSLWTGGEIHLKAYPLTIKETLCPCCTRYKNACLISTALEPFIITLYKTTPETCDWEGFFDGRRVDEGSVCVSDIFEREWNLNAGQICWQSLVYTVAKKMQIDLHR